MTIFPWVFSSAAAQAFTFTSPIVPDVYSLGKKISISISLFTSMACMNCFLNVLTTYVYTPYPSHSLSFSFLDCFFSFGVSFALSAFSVNLQPATFWCRDFCSGQRRHVIANSLFSSQVAVAVKTLKTGSTVEEKLDFLSEADMMKRFDHKNIVKLLGVCTRNEPIYTVMEFMLYGDLKTYLLAR